MRGSCGGRAGGVRVRALTAALTAVLCTGCPSQRHGNGPGLGSTGVTDRAATEARVIEYFRKTAAVPAGATLEITDWSAAGVPGWSKANLQVNSGFRSEDLHFVVSDDGRYLVRGEPVDLTVDPALAIRSQIDLKGQPVRGPADAPVTIVEYSDFQCPFCAKSSQTVEHDLLAAFPGKVRLVHKNFPLPQIHPWAQNAAIAAECALQQSNDGYWRFYEMLFEQQKTITPANLREKVLDGSAVAGLDRAKLTQCYDSKATAAQVQADVSEGHALGVNSTPTFFVNGRRLAGAVPLDNFRAAVEQELSSR
jgi:protein-disulfide isomerase